MKNQNSYRIGKTYISATTPADAQSRIEQAALSGQGGYVCVSNMRMVRYAGKNNGYANLMKQSLLNVPDGMPLVWCGRLWDYKNVSRVMGFELMDRVLRNGNNELKHFFLGDTQDVLDALVSKYRGDSNCNIVGAYSLPFADVDDFDYDGIAKMLVDSGANIIWTAMRSPKQDEFNQRLSTVLPNVVCIGVGRAFRLALGEFKDVPKAAKKFGLSGIWLRKTSLWNTLNWYFQSCFYLAYYFVQIIILRLIRRKSYE